MGIEDEKTVAPRKLGTADARPEAVPRDRASETLPEPPASEIDLDSLPHITLRGAGDLSGGTSGDGSLGDLKEIGLLGEGGMGRILLARQASLAREVAVKTLKEGAPQADVMALVREARVAGALEHPSIVPVHALGLGRDGRPLLVMKRVEGVSWRTLLGDPEHPAWKTHLVGKRTPLDANVVILTAVCHALELAHSRGIIHRDVKPDNVMIGAYGEVYLVDWGIATTPDAVPDGETLHGTPTYMAPEMARGERVDERTDVYLLGATLHRVLTGRSRHAGEDVMATILAAAKSEPATYGAGVPVMLGELCNQACAAKPSDRPSSVRAFRECLLAFERHRSALAICKVAEQRLSRLLALLEESDGVAPKDLALAYRLGTEARFGFGQSLDQFPEHDEARRGTMRCVEALADLELRQGHVETAAALLEEAPVAAASLAVRLEEARTKAAESAREHERLRALDRDLDPSVGRGARAAALGILLAVDVAIAVTLKARELTGTPTDGMALILTMIVVFATTVAAALVIRRQLLTNVFSLRAGGVLMFIELAVLANRIVGTARGTPIPSILTIDLVICAACSAVGAIGLLPRLGVITPLCLTGLALIVDDPSRATYVFPPTIIIGFGVGAWAVWTHASKKPT